MNQDTIRKAVEAATAKLPRLNGLGVLVPGGKILTAAHCIGWDCVGYMRDDDNLEPVQIGGRDFMLTACALEPITDMAVLGGLDNQRFPKEANAWEEFHETARPLEIWTGPFPLIEPVPGNIWTHEGEWLECMVEMWAEDSHTLWVTPSKGIKGGTSGGPVVDKSGRLLGVITQSADGADCESVGPIFRPHLVVPPWLLRSMLP